jgi:hypothetical protein
MHQALILIAHAIALAHDHWRRAIGAASRSPNSSLSSRRGSAAWKPRTPCPGSPRGGGLDTALMSGSRSSGTPPAIGLVRGEPDRRFAVRLLRRAVARQGAPTRLGSDRDRALRNHLVNGLLRSRGLPRRYGAVRRKGSIAIIERFRRSLEQEFVDGPLLYRSVRRPRSRRTSGATPAGSTGNARTRGWNTARPTSSTVDDHRAFPAQQRAPRCSPFQAKVRFRPVRCRPSPRVSVSRGCLDHLSTGLGPWPARFVRPAGLADPDRRALRPSSSQDLMNPASSSLLDLDRRSSPRSRLRQAGDPES